MNTRSFLASGAVLLALARPTPCAAQSESSKAAAVALFDDGQRLMAAGKFAAACPKLAESHRIDPQLGALLHLSDCYEKAGKLASAWASWRDAAEVATQRGDSREALARAHATALEPKLAKLVLEVPPHADIAGLEVRWDGAMVSRTVWGTPMPVDAGDHSIEATAPGKMKLVARMTVAKDGVVERYTVAALQDAALLAPASAPGPTVAPAAAPPAPDARTSGSTQRVLGFVAGGLGVVALGAGAYFTVKKGSLDDDRGAICPSGVGCTAKDKADIDALNGDMRDAATMQTVSFGAAGLLLTGAVVLLLTAPDSSPSRAGRWSVAPAVARDTLGFAAGTRW